MSEIPKSVVDMLKTKNEFYIENKTIEEMSELTKELTKFILKIPGRASKEHLQEEVAHVLLYVNTIMRMYDLNLFEITQEMESKIKNLEARRTPIDQTNNEDEVG
jgi:NTP pyrophosphatase (non-canonical NTP hydrolase)